MFASSHPLDPWRDKKYDVDSIETIIVNGTRQRRSISGEQKSFVVQALQSNLTTALIFVSDPCGSGSHMAVDKHYRQPLPFNDTQTPPRIQRLQWIDQFTRDFAVSKTALI